MVGFEGCGRDDEDDAESVRSTRAKTSPLRDVATMLRSFAHVAAAARRGIASSSPTPEMAATRLGAQLVEFSEIFVEFLFQRGERLRRRHRGSGTRRRLLVLYLLAAAFEEIDGGGRFKDDLEIPVDGVNAILDRAARLF